MFRTRKRALNIALPIVAVGIVAYLIIEFILSGIPYVPPAFLEARARGSVLAERIVELSKDSINNLNKISEEDRAGRYSSGLDLVIGEIERNKLARQTALALSKELETMAMKLDEVKPSSAVNVGLQAIISESQIVQRLVNYNAYIYELLSVLTERLKKRGAYGATEAAELLKKMNAESQAINDLNAKYRELMANFDGLTQKKD